MSCTPIGCFAACQTCSWHQRRLLLVIQEQVTLGESYVLQLRRDINAAEAEIQGLKADKDSPYFLIQVMTHTKYPETCMFESLTVGSGVQELTFLQFQTVCKLLYALQWHHSPPAASDPAEGESSFWGHLILQNMTAVLY